MRTEGSLEKDEATFFADAQKLPRERDRTGGEGKGRPSSTLAAMTAKKGEKLIYRESKFAPSPPSRTVNSPSPSASGRGS